MASRVREDEKKEEIIRGLPKLTNNRKCIKLQWPAEIVETVEVEHLTSNKPKEVRCRRKAGPPNWLKDYGAPTNKTRGKGVR